MVPRTKGKARKRRRSTMHAPVFRTVTSEVTEDSVRMLAQTWYGLSGETTVHDDNIEIFTDGRLFNIYSNRRGVVSRPHALDNK